MEKPMPTPKTFFTTKTPRKAKVKIGFLDFLNIIIFCCSWYPWCLGGSNRLHLGVLK
jgi:hypothetical protein